jgi:hypothetical protein
MCYYCKFQILQIQFSNNAQIRLGFTLHHFDLYHLWISVIELWISIIELWISVIELRISIIQLRISVIQFWISKIGVNYGYP